MWNVSLRKAARVAVLLILLAALEIQGLKDVQVVVPEAAAVGDTVSLYCRYDLETETLYSVKWYKGRQEFFRYIPKELPHTRVFPLPGIDVDVSRSGPLVVVLRSVPASLSGRYRCEVSADAPSFHTAMKTSYMHVVDLPESAPVITSEKLRVSVGDTLRARCIAPPAHPPANLTWILNNVPMKGTVLDLDPIVTPKTTNNPTSGYANMLAPNIRHPNNETKLVGHTYLNNDDVENEHLGIVVRGRRNMAEKRIQADTETQKRGESSTKGSMQTDDKNISVFDSLEVESGKWGNTFGYDSAAIPEEHIVKRRSGSSLVLSVTQESVQQGRMTLTCKATVFSLYNAQAHLILDGENPQIASVLGTRESSSGAKYNNEIFGMVTYITFVFLIELLR